MSPKTPKKIVGLSTNQKTLKRVLDVVLSITLIPIFILPIGVLIIAASIDTKGVGLFFQNRVGQYGKVFTIIKIRTFNETGEVSKYSAIIRKYKLDELSQLWNVLIGDMSLVGPRPNVKRETDLYTSEEKFLLKVKPGITDFSSIVFSDEGDILKDHSDPDIAYNQLIRPGKSMLGIFYIIHRNFLIDINITIFLRIQ